MSSRPISTTPASIHPPSQTQKAANLNQSSKLSLQNMWTVPVALRQIRATKHTIVRIAADCGFSDAKHLTHRFKEKFGMSPLQYRNGATPKTS